MKIENIERGPGCAVWGLTNISIRDGMAG